MDQMKSTVQSDGNSGRQKQITKVNDTDQEDEDKRKKKTMARPKQDKTKDDQNSRIFEENKQLWKCSKSRQQAGRFEEDRQRERTKFRKGQDMIWVEEDTATRTMLVIRREQ